MWRGRWVVRAWCVLLPGVLLAGCSSSPFARGEVPRTPYERYLTLRGQAPPEKVENNFGAMQPALRQRLAPMGSP
jgi:hypothetical protein